MKTLALALVFTGLLFAAPVRAGDHDGATAASASPTDAPKKIPNWDDLQKKTKALREMVGGTFYFQTGMIPIPQEAFATFDKKNPMAAAEYQTSRLATGLDKIELLVKSGVINKNLPVKSITVGLENSGPDTYGGITLNWDSSLKEIEAFLKALPSAEEMARREAAFKKRLAEFTAKTGISLHMGQGGLLAEKVTPFLDRLEKILMEPESQKKAIVQVTLMFDASQKGYFESVQTMNLPLQVTDHEIRQLVATARPAASPDVMDELKRLSADTKNAEVKKILEDKIAELKTKLTEPVRELNRKQLAFELKYGLNVFWSDRTPTPIEKKLEILNRLLQIPKDKILPGRAATTLALDPERSIAMGLDGTVRVSHEDATPEKVLAAINATPEKAAWAKEYARLREQMKAIEKKLGKDVFFHTDFDNNNTHEDALHAISVVQSLVDQGYKLNAGLKGIFFTGRHIKGWEGARPGFGGIVMRGDATEEDVKKFMHKDDGTKPIADSPFQSRPIEARQAATPPPATAPPPAASAPKQPPVPAGFVRTASGKFRFSDRNGRTWETDDAAAYAKDPSIEKLSLVVRDPATGAEETWRYTARSADMGTTSYYFGPSDASRTGIAWHQDGSISYVPTFGRYFPSGYRQR